MTCRCAERRDAIVRAAQAIARGDTAAALAEAKFVGRTSWTDVEINTKRAYSKALSRLKGRRSG